MIAKWWRIESGWLCVLVVAVLLGLIGQAYHPWWLGHLQGDVRVFHMRAVSFLDDWSWQGTGVNEYQPGALWFFVLIGWLASQPQSPDSYVTAFVLLNGALLLLHVWLMVKWGHRYSPWLFVLLSIAIGPIVLFRFELLVSLVLLVAWRQWQQGRLSVAGILLGLATAVKVYPVLLLPLLIAEGLRHRTLKRAASATAGFVGGGLLLTLPFLLTGGNLASLSEGLEYHKLKSIGLETVWGSVLPLLQNQETAPLDVRNEYGVHTFTTNVPLLTVSTLNWLWVVPYAVLVLFVLWYWRPVGYSDPGIFFVLLLVFVLTSKVSNPQYLWWFAVFLPLLPPPWFTRGGWLVVIIAVVSSFILMQIVYPVNYNEFIDWFNGRSHNSTLFWLNAARNLILVGLALVSVQGLIRRGRRISNVKNQSA